MTGNKVYSVLRRLSRLGAVVLFWAMGACGGEEVTPAKTDAGEAKLDGSVSGFCQGTPEFTCHLQIDPGCCDETIHNPECVMGTWVCPQGMLMSSSCTAMGPDCQQIPDVGVPDVVFQVDIPSQVQTDIPSQVQSDIPEGAQSDIPGGAQSDIPGGAQEDVVGEHSCSGEDYFVDFPCQATEDLGGGNWTIVCTCICSNGITWECSTEGPFGTVCCFD